MPVKRIKTGGAMPRRSPPPPRKFIELDDCPASYTGKAGQLPVVNATETGLEFKTEPVIDRHDVQVTAVDTTPNFLNDKIAAGTGISKTVLNPAGNEQLQISAAAHDLAGALHNADTITNLNLKLSDGDVISTKAAEISALTAKASPTTSDLLIIEDAADGNKKKKITIATLPAPSTVFPEFQFFADQLRTPTGSEYPRYGSTAATIAQDSANNAILIRQFDDTQDEGAGFDIYIPSGATNIILDFIHRAQTAPGAAKQIAPVLYTRQISDNVATPAWSAENHLTNLDIPTNSRYQYDTLTISLASLSLTAGLLTQFEIERDADEAGDNLVGDWNLMLLRVRFS